MEQSFFIEGYLKLFYAILLKHHIAILRFKLLYLFWVMIGSRGRNPTKLIGNDFQYKIPGRGDQIDVIPDQKNCERTHFPSALELQGLEKVSNAPESGQWSRTCLIRGHFGLGRSDLRQF